MIITGNCSISLEDGNRYYLISNYSNTVSIKFYQNGSIDYTGTQSAAIDFVFKTFFKEIFESKFDKKCNSTIKIYDCIIVHTFEGRIEYIGNFYQELPAWLKEVEERVKRFQKLKAFI